VDAAERRRFVREHRTAIYGYARQTEAPSLSVVYYLMDGDDEMLVSCMAERAKTKAAERDPHATLCVLDEQWPLTYVQVQCKVAVERDFDAAVDLLVRLSELMAETKLPDTARAPLEEMARREQRIVLRLTPYATYHTPPRHVRKVEDLEGLTHWTSSSIPW